MKAIIIKGLEMPQNGGFVDLRVYSDGKVDQVACMGHCTVLEAEEVEIPDEK